MSKNCVQCHSPIADDAKFCMICGTTQPVTETQAAAQQTSQSAPAPVPPVYDGSTQGNTGSTQSGSQSGSANSDYVYPSDKKVDPAIACLLSLLLTGLGQMINGQLAKGLVILGGSVLISSITCGVLAIPCVVLAAIDAYKCAKALEEGITIRKWSFFGKP